MISLFTGLPGSGKTLLAIEDILANKQSEKCRALYTNIDGLDFEALGCFRLENPEDWFNLPDGSIVVIDECQRFFPPRPNGSKVPESVQHFETHRHQGLDVVLITQHPSLLDNNVRKLVELHRHCYRPFGMNNRRVFEWNSCNPTPEPAQDKSNALRTVKKFDENLYKYYKSATVHTHQPRIPYKKFIMLGVIVLGIFFGFFFAFFNTKNTLIDSKDIAVSESTEVKQVENVTKSNQEISNLEPIKYFYTGHYTVSGSLSAFFFEDSLGNSYSSENFSFKMNGSKIDLFIDEQLFASFFAPELRNVVLGQGGEARDTLARNTLKTFQ